MNELCSYYASIKFQISPIASGHFHLNTNDKPIKSKYVLLERTQEIFTKTTGKRFICVVLGKVAYVSKGFSNYLVLAPSLHSIGKTWLQLVTKYVQVDTPRAHVFVVVINRFLQFLFLHKFRSIGYH